MVENLEQNRAVAERLCQVAEYLAKERVAMTNKEIATLISVNPSTLSQIMNGKVRATEKFVLKLCKLSANLNYEWIMSGEGAMLKGENPNTEQCIAEKPGENLTSALRTIELLVGQMAEKDRQIGKLIDLMAEKNTAATKDAISAAASE